MTRTVVTVGPETSAKYAAEVMAERGFAAVPVVDDGDRLVGIVAEADVLRRRMPADPRLHLRRDEDHDDDAPPLRVAGVMTRAVRAVESSADVADVARLFVDAGLRSVPVLEQGRLAGIVSRRDLLRALVRPDEQLAGELSALLESYTGETGAFAVTVADGVATVRRSTGSPQPSAEAEERAVRELAHTIGGIVAVHAVPRASAPTAPAGGAR
jgi:CBS domain-containing protein